MKNFKIYGNDVNLSLIQTMRQKGHLPHACLFYGEKNSGRKTLAKYFAMTALCSDKEHAPCGVCRNCQKVLHGSHPDLIVVEHSGKKQGFSIETVRQVCRDVIVAPNDSDKKIYLFADCDNIGIPAQNALLKLTEEPPEHVILLFTAGAKSVFLETMLSRMMQIAVRPCTLEECRTALTEQHHIPPEQAEQALQASGGNIGFALEWLENSSVQELTQQVSALTLALVKGNYYEMLRIFSGFEKERTQTEQYLKLLDLQFRDAYLLRCGNTALAGCDRQSAEALSASLTAGRVIHLHEAVQSAFEALQANVSPKLVLAALGGELFLY